MSETRMRVARLVIDDCARIRIRPDPENGCIDFTFYDEREHSWTRFELMVFGVRDEMPGLELTQPIEPDPEEVAADEQDVVG